MDDTNKTMAQLIEEITALRQRVAVLETVCQDEENHTGLFYGHHAAMLLINPDTGDIVDANPAACAFYGYSHAELTTKNVTDLNMLSAEQTRAEMHRARTQQRNYFNFRHRLANGDIRDVEVYSGPVETHGQRLLYSIIHDITERRETLARYKSLFEHSPIALWEEDFSDVKAYLDQLCAGEVTDLAAYFDAHPDDVIHCSSLVKIVNINQATLDMFRAATPDELYGGLDRVFGPESFDMFREELLALAAGQTQFHAEIPGYPLTGEPIHTLIWLTIVPGCEDTWEKVFVSVLDTTEHKQAEQALRESEDRFRRLANLTFEGIVIHILGDIQDANQTFAGMFGYSLQDLYDIHLLDLFTPETRAIVDYNIRSDYEETYEAAGVRADGSVFPVEILAKAVPYKGRKARVAAFRNITDRKREEQRALELALEREKVKVLERFLSDASHDLKTPITTMKVSLTVLDRAQDDVTKYQRHLAILNTQIEHLQKLMEDLLNIARLDQVTHLRVNTLELNMVVESVIAETRTLAHQKQHTFEFLPDSDRIPLIGDRDKLAQAIRALVTNALNYTPTGGTITVRTHTDANNVVIEVKDTGIGIKPQDKLHIFKRFYRADPARSTYSGGMGLGLSIAQKIVEAHRGRIDVESVPDVGSTFTITLPKV